MKPKAGKIYLDGPDLIFCEKIYNIIKIKKKKFIVFLCKFGYKKNPLADYAHATCLLVV